MEIKRKNLAKLLGKDPEGLSREEFNAALERHYNKLKAKYKDPVYASEILEQDLQKAFTDDFTSFPEKKDISKLPEELFPLYNLTPKQKEKISFKLNEPSPNIYGSEMGGATYVNPEHEKLRYYEPLGLTPQQKKDLFIKKKTEFFTDPRTNISPEVNIYKEKSGMPSYESLPHELLHAADMLQHRYTEGYRVPNPYPYMSEVPKSIQEEIEKDPSLANVKYQTGSTMHFQPLYVANPPIERFQEFVYNKTNPFVPKSTKDLEPPISQEELYNALYDMDSGGYSTDPLMPNRFSRLSKMFKEVNKNKLATPKKSASKSDIEPMFSPEEFEEMIQKEAIDE